MHYGSPIEERNRRFRSALRKAAPGRTVLDIGTGKDVLWAREAVACGAARVLAMETMGESFRLARAAVESGGLQDEITLLEGLSTELEIDPKADVCVAEVIGSLAGAEGAAAIFTDARHRLLNPGGTVIPHRAVSQAGAVCLSEVMGGRPVAFAHESIKYLQGIFDWNGAPFDVRLRVRNPVTTAIVSDHAPVEVLDFNGGLETRQQAAVTLSVDRPGRIDGVLAWLELWCEPDVPPLTALDDKTSWASVYFPLFDSEVEVGPGDELDLTFRTSLSDNGVNPDYRLEAVLRTARGERLTGAHHSPHHGRDFRRRALYRALFPEPR